MARWLPLTLPALLAAAPLHAQGADTLAIRLAAMTAVTGFEQPVADSIHRLLPGSRIDRAGNVLRTWGSGTGGTLVACPLDEPGYVVGGIRPDGWLTLRRVGRSWDPSFDRHLEGQRVTVWGRHGALPGVIAVRSVHLTRGRGDADRPFTSDDALVDIGASDSAAAVAGGATVLSPVARDKRPIRYGDGLLAAPAAGRRAACAAVIVAARSLRPQGRVVVAFTVEQQLGERGLLTAMNLDGPFDRTLLLDGRAGALGAVIAQDDSLAGARFRSLGRVSRLDLPVRYAGTGVETVSLADVRALAQRLVTELGGAR